MQDFNYQNDTMSVMEKLSSMELKFLIFAEKLRTLERQKQTLEIEQKKLNISLERLRNENKELKNKVNSGEDFQNSKKIAKIVSNKLNEAGDTAEWRELIKDLIEEIDRCTELLQAF